MSKLRNIIMGDAPKDLGKIQDWLEKGEPYQKAYDNFLKKKLESIIKMEYDADLLGPKMKEIKEYEQSVKVIIKEKTAKEHNNAFVFITINPNEATTLTQLEEKVEKFVNRNMFSAYRYVYEQRGSNEKDMGKGFHTHILLKRNLDYKPSKIALNTKNTFKGITNVDNPQILNIQHIGEDFAKDKDEYMTGIKTGEGKDEKQAIDKLWRVKNNLESVYGEEFFQN
jgi:hypothetical protein